MKINARGGKKNQKLSTAIASRQPKSANQLPRVETIEPRILLSTYTVNTLSDAANPGQGLMSLRQAVASANAHPGADTISFAPKVFPAGIPHTIKLLSGQVSFTDKTGPTTLTGPGAAIAAVDGNNADRIFNINAGVTVSISGLTITHGSAPVGNEGGGIFSAGTLTLNSVKVANSRSRTARFRQTRPMEIPLGRISQELIVVGQPAAGFVRGALFQSPRQRSVETALRVARMQRGKDTFLNIMVLAAGSEVQLPLALPLSSLLHGSPETTRPAETESLTAPVTARALGVGSIRRTH